MPWRLWGRPFHYPSDGYLIIYNVFQISVIKDIRYYGLLKTIGTTGPQVEDRGAAGLAPGGRGSLGPALGFVIGKWIVPLVLARSSYAGGEVEVSLNPSSSWVPSCSALPLWDFHKETGQDRGRVSPVEAVRYTEGAKEKRKRNVPQTAGRSGGWFCPTLGEARKDSDHHPPCPCRWCCLIGFNISGSFSMDKFLRSMWCRIS